MKPFATFFKRVAWLLFLILTIPLSIQPAHGSVFDIRNIEVEIPLPIAPNHTPRSLGLVRAQEMAFTQLFNRMLTRSNQDFNRDFLNTLRREKNRFIQRSVVRAERRRLHLFQIVVDVSFSKREVSEAFARAGIPHSQSEYPRALLVVKANTQNSQKHFRTALTQMSAQYGIALRQPLGDMEDVTQLNWQRMADNDPAFHTWIQDRYQTQRVWAVRMILKADETPSAQTRLYTANAQLLELSQRSKNPPILAQARGSYAGVEQAQDVLFPAMAQVLLQQLADRWVDVHSVEPTLRHDVPLRIVHNFNHMKYEKFLDSLHVIPGFSGFQYQTMSAREVVILIDYQGLDEALFSAISRLGVQIQSSQEGMVVYLL